MAKKPPKDPHPENGADDGAKEQTSARTSTLPKARRAAAFMAGEQLRQMLDRAPTVSLSRAVTQLPEVEAPRIDDIVVTVPAPEPIGADQILERFYELRRAHAEVVKRAEGEPAQKGDEVRIDVIGFLGEGVIPFSVRSDMWTTVEPNPLLPGLMEALVGTPVGESISVDVTLPDDYPVKELRGQTGVFAVTLHEAIGVTLPNEKDPRFFAATGLGETVEEVMEGIAEALRDELADQLVEKGRQMVLDELARRTEVEVPATLIDEEIRRRWHDVEGRVLAAMGLSFEEQERALEAWRRDPYTRAEVERALRISLALGAIVKRDGVEVDKEAVERYLRGLAEGAGAPMQELVDALKADPALQKTVQDKLLHLLAVEHVMVLAEIRFEGAEDIEEVGATSSAP